MPMDRSKYPDDWEQISHRIRFERAGGKCELCGARHGAYIIRSDQNPARYIVFDDHRPEYFYLDGMRMHIVDLPDEFEIMHFIRVVLTVHHIGVDKPDGTPGSPHDKMDCRDENLLALCQRCHLLADLPHHILARKRTRLEHKAQAARAAGQLELFE